MQEVRTVSLRVARSLVWLLLPLLAGCEGLLASKYDINSRFYKIPAGSRLVLHESLNIPAGKAHVVIQSGRIIPGANQYAVNCEFQVRTLGPGQVNPDTFTITRAERSREWISQPNILRFYRVLHLQSAVQPDVLKLVCQDWDGPLIGRDISVPEMRAALGDIITLEFASR